MGNTCVKDDTINSKNANTEVPANNLTKEINTVEEGANNQTKEINTVEEGAASNKAKEINIVEEEAANNKGKEINIVEEGAANNPDKETNAVEEEAANNKAKEINIVEEGAASNQAKEIGSVEIDGGAANDAVEETAASDPGEIDEVVEVVEGANDPDKGIGPVENIACGLVLEFGHSSPPKPQVEMRDPSVDEVREPFVEESPSHVVTSAVLTSSGVDSEDTKAYDPKSDLLADDPKSDLLLADVGEVKEVRPEDLGQQHNTNERSETENEVILSSSEISINEGVDLEKSGQTESTINSLPSSPVQEEELLPEIAEHLPKVDSMTLSELERPESQSESGESTPVALEQPSKSEKAIFGSELEKCTPELGLQPLAESSLPELEQPSYLEPFGKSEPEPLAEIEMSTEIQLEQLRELDVSNSMPANESSRLEASPDGGKSPQADRVQPERMQLSPEPIEASLPTIEPEESITHVITPNIESPLQDKSYAHQPAPSQISEPEESFPQDLELSPPKAEELALKLEEPSAQDEPEESSSPVESESNPHISELDEPESSLQESSPHFETSSPLSEQEDLPILSDEPSQSQPKESIFPLNNFSEPEDPSHPEESSQDESLPQDELEESFPQAEPEESFSQNQPEESFPQAEPEESFPQAEPEEPFLQDEPVNCEESSPETEPEKSSQVEEISSPQLSESQDFSLNILSP